MSEKYLDIEIISPQSVLFSGKASAVFVPGAKGPFEILINHAPIVSSLDPGIVKVIDDANQTGIFACDSGFVEVHRNHVSILVGSALEKDKIKPESVKSDLDKVNTKLKNANSDEEKSLLKKNIDYLKIQLKASEIA
jgi:F-type H+-transporting ATPase subunit epsilon